MKAKKNIISLALGLCIACTSVMSGCSKAEENNEASGKTSGQAAETSEAEPAAVRNGFEVNYDGWCAENRSVRLTAEEGMGYGGSRGMTVSGRSKATDDVYSIKGMYLSGNVEYNYKVMVYSDSAETFHLNLLCTDKTGKKTETELASAEAEAGKWTELSADHTAPEGSGTFRLSLSTDSAADFRFDDLVIMPKDKSVLEKSAEKGLKDEFADYFRVGNILNVNTVKDAGVLENVLKNYSSITCENEMKPDSTLVQKLCTEDNIAVSINNAAPIFDFCAQNNIGLRGHVLIWHSQTPSWFFKEDFKAKGDWVTPEVMDKRMESYIKNIFETIKTQYPGVDLYAYDVVNEAVSDDNMRNIMYGGAREAGDNNAQGGKSAWVQIYGDNSFIEKAFIYARKYAPEGCKLYYNDYNEYWNHKRDKIYDMCKNLYNKGLLDGIGMQSHVNAEFDGFSGAPNHKTAMEKYLSIGCDVQITELDMNCENGKYTPEQQAEKYAAIFKAAMDYNKNPAYDGRVTAICLWGPNDGNTWLGSQNTPMLHDKDNKPKAAYNKLIELVPASEWGDGSSPAKNDRPKKEINLEKTDDDRVTAVIKKEETPAEEGNGAAASGGGSYSDDFEESTGDWIGRGSASVSLSKDAALGGGSSLFVEGRTAAWNGASKYLFPEDFAPGSKCSFSANVMYNDGGDTDTFYMKLQYVDESGTTIYASVAEGEAEKGKWLLLENTDYEIPSDASDMQIYVETANSTNNFYLDDAAGKCSSSGAANTETAAAEVTELNFGAEWDNDADISWIDVSKPMAALSFDDGPVGKKDTDTSIRIQNAISQNGGHATFFYWGNRINKVNEAEITRAKELGFEIANHTYTHPDLSKLTPEKIQSEVTRSADKLRELTGQQNFLLRPPYLAVNDKVCKNSGAPLITCAVDTADWNGASAQDIIDGIKAKMDNMSLDGCVVLMHETYDSTAEAIEYLAPYMKEQGWQIVTVSEMFKAKDKKMQNGKVYTKAA